MIVPFETKVDNDLVLSILYEMGNLQDKKSLFKFIEERIKNHSKTLDNHGVFNTWFENGDLKSKLKKHLYNPQSNEVFTVLNISANANINDRQYTLISKLSGLIQTYAEAIIKKKIRKFINSSFLTFIKIVETTNCGEKEILNLGQEHLGNILRKVEI